MMTTNTTTSPTDEPSKTASMELKEDSNAYEDSPHAVGEYVPGTDAEKRLLRKIDLRILPCVWLLYLLGYLDRANIGNAKTGGLEDEFNLTDNQYSVILLIFFVSYVLFEVPSNLLLTRVRPSLYLSGLAVIWGGIAACMAATHNWKQLAGIRFCLGIVEAGFAPGIAFYLSSWYRRYELAKRYAIYYTAVSCAGAFSGLLAGLITHYLDGAHGIAGWRWLFIIEGCGSSALGLVVWFFMPDWPSTTRGLTPEERLLACQRLTHDGIGNTQGEGEMIKPVQAIKMAFTDWKVWTLVFLYMLITGAQTMQYFIPTLVGIFGWKDWEGQYHTIPPYAWGLVCTLTFCFISDYYKNKERFICLFAGINTVFFIIVSSVTNNTVRYIFTIFAFGSINGISPLILMWVANVIDAPAEKRAVAIALVNALGNSSSIYGVFLWPSTDAPRFIPGFSATTCFMGLIAIIAPIAGWQFNKQKKAAAADADMYGDGDKKTVDV